MATSILSSTKEALGLDAEYTAFDGQIKMHINGLFSDLTQMGIGPKQGFRIEDPTTTWEEFLGLSEKYEDFDGDATLLLSSAMNWMYLKVKMLFDPPQVGYVLTSIEKLILEETWRLTEKSEEIRNKPPVKPEPILVVYGEIEP